MRTKNKPLLELLRSQEDEILKYKWLESEKNGQDIGLKKAEQEWLSKHFPAWHKHCWNRLIAEALRKN